MTASVSEARNSLSLGRGRYSDLVLAFGVVGIVSIMILPLPVAVLDVLVAMNISIGVILVLMAIYVSSPLQFSVFPSVLLISTLFRLSLSVATTRMILLHADAGNIIDTFGEVVAGGNIVVGLVVFLIITLVQFIVIAKGAERVAEVGARFTLDAMPGKQMSIDSDLRSGLIGKVEAKSKRSEIELESKLHGSMDGAMKFVKGDAIAGIVIIIINLLGGLMVGVFQRDLDVGVAMHEYSILTIGDGMVAQIPALLGAMSAGLIVTRVKGDDDTHLGDSMAKQFTAIPRVLLVAGAMCLLFAVVPGFPGTVFIGLGFCLLIGGAVLVPTFKSRLMRASQPTFESVLSERAQTALRTNVESTSEVSSVDYAVPLSLSLPLQFARNGADEMLRVELSDLIEKHSQYLGVRLPSLRFDWAETDAVHWQLIAYEVPVVSGRITDNNALVEGVFQGLRKNAGLFIGMQETRQLLVAASDDFPDIVKEVERVLPMQDLATVFRTLIEEEIPIRNLRGVLEAIVTAASRDKDPSNLVEHVRIALSRQTCYRVAPQGELRALTLDNDLQAKLIEALRSRSGTEEMVIDPTLVNTLKENALGLIDQHKPQAVVVKVPLRRHLRMLLSKQAFETPVLSFEELDPNLSLNLVASVEAQ